MAVACGGTAAAFVVIRYAQQANRLEFAMLLGRQPGGSQNPGAKQHEAAEHAAKVVRVGTSVKVSAADGRTVAGQSDPGTRVPGSRVG